MAGGRPATGRTLSARDAPATAGRDPAAHPAAGLAVAPAASTAATTPSRTILIIAPIACHIRAPRRPFARIAARARNVKNQRSRYSIRRRVDAGVCGDHAAWLQADFWLYAEQALANRDGREINL